MDKALKRFRFIAYLAGVILIIFTFEIIIKYTLGPEIPWFAQLHSKDRRNSAPWIWK